MAGTVTKWLAILCFLAAIPASGNAPPWTWKDSKHVVRSEAELNSILAEHRVWLDTQGTGGKRADLSGADLAGADFDHMDLRGVDLSDANLTGADFTGAKLTCADIVGPPDPNRPDLLPKPVCANLAGAMLREADFTGAELSGANLKRAHLVDATLTGGEVGQPGATLEDAILDGADLSGANFTGADLRGAHLIDACFHEACPGATAEEKANMDATDLEFAKLYFALYEPTQYTDPSQIGSALGLATLRYQDNPKPIVDLRNALRDSGFLQPEREVNQAYHRHDPNRPPSLGQYLDRDWLREAPQWDKHVLSWGERITYWYQIAMYWIGEVVTWGERVVFDWTCGWGAYPARPLIIIAVLALCCTPVYWIGMHFETNRIGLFLVASGERIRTGAARDRVMRIIVNPAPPMHGKTLWELGPGAWIAAFWRTRRKWLKLEFRALRTAFLFSLMSVFNIGFDGFNGGEWIKMLQKREFDIRARGWMRTVSGVQSLFGVGLLALSILSYFGHPFE